MLIKNSLQQLKRMPLKVILFILLVSTASCICCLGINLWIINGQNMQKYEHSFMTIGTVEQKAETIKEAEVWDQEIKEYVTYNTVEYESYLPSSILDSRKNIYLTMPEQRAYYGAYCPDLVLDSTGSLDDGIVVEASPVENCIPDAPIKIKISKVLYGQKTYEGTEITFCDHYNERPEVMYADKVYVMSLIERPSHSEGTEERMSLEFVPAYELKSTQTDSQGVIIDDGIEQDFYCDEVTEGYYETERGRRWKEYIDGKDRLLNTLPVTGTNNINIIMPFYCGDAFVSEGETISESEYKEGKNVCLVPVDFAKNNNLLVGDAIQLSLYSANYSRSAAQDFPNNGGRRTVSPLNSMGQVYQIFQDDSYIIVGIYSFKPGVGLYGVGKNEIFVPSKSIESSVNNIVEYGPMKNNTTSFQIENGRIKEFYEEWNKKGISNVEITFYDKGYSELASGMENMKNGSSLIVTMGIVISVLVFCFASYIFVSKQKERTAIERSLGLKKRQCFMSLFVGIFVMILLGSILGCALGTVFTKDVSDSMQNTSYYDTEFGNSVALSDDSLEWIESEELKGSFEISFQVLIGLVMEGSIISCLFIAYNLKNEPLKLLGKRKMG